VIWFCCECGKIATGATEMTILNTKMICRECHAKHPYMVEKKRKQDIDESERADDDYDAMRDRKDEEEHKGY